MYQTIPVRYLDAWLEQGYTGRLIDLRTPEEYNVSLSNTKALTPLGKKLRKGKSIRLKRKLSLTKVLPNR